MTSLIIALIPLVLKIISWILDAIDADKKSKKAFVDFVQAWESRNQSTDIHDNEYKCFQEIKKIKEELNSKK
jgi:cell fate (sporulation/competence/biofilm development) regulator YlbF (YheA/YmcA/DUF963 family)